jgi:hypothetical protein
MTQQEIHDRIVTNPRYKNLSPTYLREIISLAYKEGAKVQLVQIKHPVPDGLWYSNFTGKQYFAIEVVGGFRVFHKPELLIKWEHCQLKNPNYTGKFLRSKTKKEKTDATI